MSARTSWTPRASHAAICLVGALWLDFSRLQAEHQSDSLIPTLVSLQRWTPFFWGQNRFGMLLPLLASPLRVPLHNLLFQCAITCFAGLVVFGLLASVVAPGRDTIPEALLSTALFILFVPAPGRFDHFIAQPYAVSLALALGGVAVLSPREGKVRLWQFGLCIVLTAAGYWVNGTLAVLLIPLILARHLLQLVRVGWGKYRGESFIVELVAGLLINAIAQWSSTAWLTRHPDGNPYFETTPSSTWPTAWAALVHQLINQARGTGWLLQLLLIGAVGLVLVVVVKSDVSRLQVLGSALALVGAALCLTLVLGTNLWVSRNAFAPRYMLPAQVLLQVAVVMLWSPVLNRSEKAMAAAGALVLAISLAVRYGVPGPGVVRAALFEDKRAQTMATAGCTHVVGDYWRVWPLVLKTMQARAELGVQQPIYGLTTRSEATQSMAISVPLVERVVCGALEDRWAESGARSVLGRQGSVTHAEGAFIVR